MSVKILIGDSIEQLKTLPDQSVHCAVTSPPYFGLRDYGMDGQIGLESTPDEFIARLVEVFREVRRVLRSDGTAWVNMGDSYAANRGYQVPSTLMNGDATNAAQAGAGQGMKAADFGVKPKDLLGIPWMLAFALRADGWWLRQDIIWSKPNPMPESVTDRCTKAHEYIFLLSKSANYYYDNEAIKEPSTLSTVERLSQANLENQAGSDRVPGKTNGTMKAVGQRSARDSFKREDSKRAEVMPGQSMGTHRPDRDESQWDIGKRNKRSVWTVATQPFKEAHFATFPPALIEPCILAGCPPNGTVLDPFFGAGTTGLVADRLQRSCIGIELNPAYALMARNRIDSEMPLFNSKGSGKRLKSIEETRQLSLSVPVDMSSFNEATHEN